MSLIRLFKDNSEIKRQVKTFKKLSKLDWQWRYFYGKCNC